MKYCKIGLFVLVGLLFYLFHYAIVPLNGNHLPDALGYSLIQMLWYLLGVTVLFIVDKSCGLGCRQRGIGFVVIVFFGVIAQLLHMPDKIDFLLAKKYLEKVVADYPKDKPQWVIISSSYETPWPKRMPFICDSRHYAFGAPTQIAKMTVEVEGCYFVQVDKGGWYILYEENIYGQGRP